jgi:hypothetical protein
MVYSCRKAAHYKVLRYYIVGCHAKNNRSFHSMCSPPSFYERTPSHPLRRHHLSHFQHNRRENIPPFFFCGDLKQGLQSGVGDGGDGDGGVGNGGENYLARYFFFLDALLGNKRMTPFQKRGGASVPNGPKFSDAEGPLLTDETVRFTGIQTRSKPDHGVGITC